MPPSAAATVGLGSWSFDPPFALLLCAAALYALGARRTVTPARTRVAQRGRDAAFYAALATLVIALCSPVDAYSERLFWMHMVQHVLLLMVAAPLLVLARPWLRLWRALPLGARVPLARALAKGEAASPLRALVRWLGRPVPALVLFCVTLLGWHVPALFDGTLRSEWLHALEHTMFLTTALVFWKQVIDSPPLHAPLAPVQRVLYVIVAMIVSWALAVVLALAPHTLYAHYAHLAHRPGGISALADQQIAAGIMWVPGSVTFIVVVFAYVHRWLLPPAAARATRRVHA